MFPVESRFYGVIAKIGIIERKIKKVLTRTTNADDKMERGAPPCDDGAENQTRRAANDAERVVDV